MVWKLKWPSIEKKALHPWFRGTRRSEAAESLLKENVGLSRAAVILYITSSFPESSQEKQEVSPRVENKKILQ